jgi:hypothetical protein
MPEDGGHPERVERVVPWMLELGIRPNHDLRKAVATMLLSYLRKGDTGNEAERAERVASWVSELGLGRPDRNLRKAMAGAKGPAKGTSTAPSEATDDEREIAELLKLLS